MKNLLLASLVLIAPKLSAAAPEFSCNVRAHQEQLVLAVKNQVDRQIREELTKLGFRWKEDTFKLRVRDVTELGSGSTTPIDHLLLRISGVLETETSQKLAIASTFGWDIEGPFYLPTLVRYESINPDGSFVNGTCWTNNKSMSSNILISNPSTGIVISKFVPEDFEIYRFQ